MLKHLLQTCKSLCSSVVITLFGNSCQQCKKKIMESKIYQEVYKTFDRPNDYEILFVSIKICSYHRFPVARKYLSIDLLFF